MANRLLLPSPNQWPVGFRFHPTDEELINHYLKNKIVGQESLVQFIPQVDICKYEPWELPGLSNDQTGEQRWFFFSAQDFKYSNGRRSKRATGTGYWKSTGKDRKIRARGTNKLIGTKKTLVFYRGRVPKGIRTNWVIHEYHLHPEPNFTYLTSYVICLLKRKWDESDVLIRDEAERNDLLTSTNVATTNQNKEIPGNGQSLIQPDLHVSDYDFPELQSPLFSEPEPTSLGFQITNSHGAHVINRPTDEAINSVFVDDENFFHEGTPNSSFSDFNWEELLNLVDEDQSSSGMDTTPTCQYDHDFPIFFDKRARSIIQTKNMPIIEESHRSPLASKILKTGGVEELSSTRHRKESFQINSCHRDDSDKELRNFSSRRQLKYHKELQNVELQSVELQSGVELQSVELQSVRSIDLSSVHPHEDVMSINCLTLCHSDDSDREGRNFSSQRQPKPHKDLDHVESSQSIRSIDLSFVHPSEDFMSINCLTLCRSDDSDRAGRNFSSQRQPTKSHKVLDHVESSQNVQSIDLSSPRPRIDGMYINCITSCRSDDYDKAIRNFSSQHQPKSHKVLDHVESSENGRSIDLSSARHRKDVMSINCITSCGSTDFDRAVRNFSSQRQPKSHKVLDHVESSENGRSIDISSARHRKDVMSINCITSCGSADSDRAVRNFSSQRQPKSHKVRDHIKASQNVQSKKETQLQLVSSLSKVKAVPERIEVVKPAASSNKDTAEDKLSEVENGAANRPKPTGQGSRGSRIMFLKYPDYKMHSPQIKSRLVFGQSMCRLHFVREGRKTSATVWKLRINGAGNYTHTNKLPMFSCTKMEF
ncbi:uncharacterized protein LOC103492204 [Cucumis melo]|uniref:Uncharacterized protein LOC103492204 n=1 Tax=Cucumis melo TaxID=3656 RepID=A0A1S4DYZ1_CUCME|nr:uncharacterized protein LOC103492204 [Cucumis melo]